MASKGGSRPVVRPDDRRKQNPGGGRQGSGRKRKPRRLIVDGMQQPGLYTVEVTQEEIVITTAARTGDSAEKVGE